MVKEDLYRIKRVALRDQAARIGQAAAVAAVAGPEACSSIHAATQLCRLSAARYSTGSLAEFTRRFTLSSNGPPFCVRINRVTRVQPRFLGKTGATSPVRRGAGAEHSVLRTGA